MISPDTIALVRERTNIVAVIQESVPSLKRRGRSFVGLCPFHKEKTPSFHVNPDRGFFHCFGCQESGSAIDFLMKHDGLTFPESVRALADRCGIEVAEDQKRDQPEVDRQKKHKDDLHAVMSVAATFYERQLHEHADKAYALEELQKRGLEPTADVIQQFRIGYAPAAWDALAQHLKSQGLSPSLAEQVGLLVPRPSGGGHYDRFRHRLIFCVMDTQGRVVAFSGRALVPKEGSHPSSRASPAHLPAGLPDGSTPTGASAPPVPPAHDPPPKYVNSPESPIYTKGNLLFGLFQARHAIRHDDVAVVVEGNFDVVSLHARGLQNVVAPLGTAFTDEQAKLLRRYTGRVVLSFDGDAAGRKATRAAREPCRAAGVSVRVAVMPAGADPDTLAREKGIDAMKDAIAQARGLVEFLIDDLLDESFNAADASEKAARVQGVAKLLADEDDPLVRATRKQRVDMLSGRLDLVRREESARGDHSPDAFRALQAAVNRVVERTRSAPEKRRPGEVAEAPNRARHDNKNPGRAAMFAIVGAIIEFPELLDDSEIVAISNMLDGDAARTCAAIPAFMATTSDGRRTLYANEFLGHLAGNVRSFAAKHLAAPKHETLADAKNEAILNATRLRAYLTERETSDVAGEQRREMGWDDSVRLADEVARKHKDRHGLK